MADMISRFRTNYFHVTDERRFLKLMAAAGFQNSRLWQDEDTGAWGFGSANGDLDDCTSSAVLILKDHPDAELPPRNNLTDYAYEQALRAWCVEHDIDPDVLDYSEPDEKADALIELLQQLLRDDDAIIIETINYEKLRYLHADAVIVTKTEKSYVTLNQAIEAVVRAKMPGDYIYKLQY